MSELKLTREQAETIRDEIDDRLSAIDVLLMLRECGVGLPTPCTWDEILRAVVAALDADWKCPRCDGQHDSARSCQLAGFEPKRAACRLCGEFSSAQVCWDCTKPAAALDQKPGCPVMLALDTGEQWTLDSVSGGAAPEGIMGVLHVRHTHPDGSENVEMYRRETPATDSPDRPEQSEPCYAALAPEPTLAPEPDAGALKVGDLVEWSGTEWTVVIVREYADIYSKRSGATYRVRTSDLKRVEDR